MYRSLIRQTERTRLVALLALIGLGIWLERGPILDEVGTVNSIRTEVTLREKLYASAMNTFERHEFTGMGAGTGGWALPVCQDSVLGVLFACPLRPVGAVG